MKIRTTHMAGIHVADTLYRTSQGMMAVVVGGYWETRDSVRRALINSINGGHQPMAKAGKAATSRGDGMQATENALMDQPGLTVPGKQTRSSTGRAIDS